MSHSSSKIIVGHSGTCIRLPVELGVEKSIYSVNQNTYISFIYIHVYIRRYGNKNFVYSRMRHVTRRITERVNYIENLNRVYLDGIILYI